MKITPDPMMTTATFSQEDNLHRVCVRDEEVFHFDLSDNWVITKATVTKNRDALVLTIERRKEKTE